MSNLTTSVDYGGARGSNAGDQFHELWALQQTLELLSPNSELKAVGVEGVRTEVSAQTADNPTWDGVDCALYYDGTSLETAERVEFAQLKYSAANPEKVWSVSRLTQSTAKKGNNSVIRRMADDYKDARARMKHGAPLKIRLVSNQNVSADLTKTIDTRWSGSLKNATIDPSIKKNLQNLIKATGIAENEFKIFLETLDFTGCGSQSRFAVEEKVVAIATSLLGDDVSSEVRELQINIRKLMMAERAGEIVTEKEILYWFNVGGRDGLFPCPPDVRAPAKIVERKAADEAVNLLVKGEHLVLIHGAGGCGKTTLMRQIADRLPSGSVTVFFDCFGGGRYLQTDDKRHLPENAFLQLSNDLATTLHLPLFIPRSLKNPANIKQFMQKLRSSGKVLEKLAPQGILLIIIDAADNSVAAAHNATPPEASFVHELFGADLDSLPKNIRFITSCRTDPARRESVRLPTATPEVLCSSFSQQETKLHLDATFCNLSDNLVEQFHQLSDGNPRVQAYAIAAAEGKASRLLAALLPGGKSLSDVLKEQFKNALQKLGHPKKYDDLIDTLAFLPAPINVSALARITDTSEDIVRDFATDLWPGLRLKGNEITIADEDFEAFITGKGSANQVTVTTSIAADFYKTLHVDHYSSLHVADALIAAGRAHDVLSVIECDPQVAAISDPIVRRQVQVRRLKLSLTACREAGSTTDALKTVLISAEAEHDDSTLNEVLEKELDLSVEFAGSSLRRTILLDPERIESQGSFLAQDAVRAIRSGDRATAREQLHFHEAWLNRRRTVENNDMNSWTVTDHDISARVETILELGGPKAAFHELLRWTPRDIAIRVAVIIVPQLIAGGKTEHLKMLLNECLSHSPWDLLLLVPLAMAGELIDRAAVERSLRHLRKRFIPDINTISASHIDEGWQQTLLDTLITACELAYKMGLDSQIVLAAVNLILLTHEGEKKRYLYIFDVCRIDGLFRCWLLRELICGRTTKAEDFIAYTTSLNSEPEPVKKNKGKRAKKCAEKHHADNRDIEKINKKLKAIYPVYLARLEILSSAREGHQINETQLDKLQNIAAHAYDFDHDHESSKLRIVAAQSVMGLLIVDDIKASELVKRASALSKGRYSDSFASNRLKLWSRMSLRNSEAESLLKLVAFTAEDIKKLREASSSKLEALIHLCRLILPISRDDAAALFNDAVGIAKEIDQEAFDQIDFLSVLADRAHMSVQHEHKTIATDIFTFVSGAAERLSGYDHFPWQSAVNALTCVNDTVALAAICRWADDGTVALDQTLDNYLLTALQRGIISLEVASSLTLLVGGSGEKLWKELVSRATEEPLYNKEVIEGLAKETLLLTPQQSRLKLGQEIISRIPDGSMLDGEWFTHLKRTIEFLKHVNIPTAEESVSEYSSPTPFVDDYHPPPAFEFNPQGKVFTTPESIAEVLQVAKASGLRHDDRELLRSMKEAASNLRDRIPFLNALAKIPDDTIWETTRIDMICEAIREWKGTPAVNAWCKETLPSVLIAHFYGATRWLKEGDSALHRLLDHAGLDDDNRLKIILAGVATAGEALNSRSLFAIAEEIARVIDVAEAGNLLVWYSERLRNRLPAEDHTILMSDDIPSDTTEAVARFMYALMSDIDTRIRWKAAHALRRLAKLGCLAIVKATVSQSSRIRDNAFRDPTAPFYFLAAKLWLTISLYRISVETPETLSLYKDQIFNIATSSELPHVAIREYAKKTLLQLAASGLIALTASEKDQVDKVNTELKGKIESGQDHWRSFGRARDSKRRFRFDETDTIRYWYEDILRIFPTVSQEEVLAIAEKWIVDTWGADSEICAWDKQPRKARYNDRSYALWSHRHGCFPTIERNNTHLEWNAMYCTVGELLTTNPISSDEEGQYGTLGYWLSHVLLTDDQEWLSDHRGPTPLDHRLWTDDTRTDRGWLHSLSRAELLNEVGVTGPCRHGWVVVSGNYTARFTKRETHVRINSSLVSPETAPALVRALQTEKDVWGLRLPYDNSDSQTDSEPFRQIGWIRYLDGDLRFDDNDSFRYEVGRIHVNPGRKVTKALGLVPQAGVHPTWISSGTGDVVFRYEAWCDDPSPEDDYYPRCIRSSGWRLWAKADKVQAFFATGGWDLICEVQVERELRKEYGRAHESAEKEKTHNKIILFRSDGSVVDAKGCIGAWTGIGQGVGSPAR